MNKNEFICSFLDRKMKNHGLPYGLAYFSLLNKMEEKAQKAWKKHKNKKNGLC